MSVFSRLDKLTSRCVDRAMSIRFELHPAKASANGRPGPDPDREPWDGRGVLEEEAVQPAVEIGKRDGSGNDLRAVLSGVVTELSVDVNRWSQAGRARQGDLIMTDDMRRFAISQVKPDGISRVVYRLSEMTADFSSWV